ncbi:adenosylcobinamide-phosphate synthase CbiB [Metabacillus herbersteinensis]|uniref:Cobalamin biosynthesis protein CobD n=1 Tax=Metabacillus herbersteinensis TaxID=283816 RepID=A0ABV6GCZ9_9BACI
MIYEHIIAILLAIVLDLLIGDPRWLPHPVRGIGKILSYCDAKLNKGLHRKSKGIITIIITCVFPFLSCTFLIILTYSMHQWLGIFVESVLIFTTIASTSLKNAAVDVAIPLKANNLVEARKKLSWIVGRDTEQLNEDEIVRATVETVAENTCDGITAPLFFALIGGAPLAIAYRAVNTADSMIGNKSPKYLEFGWASARFDDLLNYLPSRLTAIAMIIGSCLNRKTSLPYKLKILGRDARKHPSPNSGFGEATVAAILGVQLGGTNTYNGIQSIRPKLGDEKYQLEQKHIYEAVAVMYHSIFIFALGLIIGGMIIEFTFAWSESSPFIFFIGN